jgi:quinol monooxygenase YgiN
MIGVVATLKVKDGEGAGLEAVFRELAAKVKANEAGCVAYQLTKSRADPNTYKVLEIYKDQDALTAHGQSDHFKEMAPKMGPFLGGRPEVEYLDGCE